MEPNIFISGDSAIGKGLKHWWSGLKDDRATRATLRRCASLDDVVLSPAYQRFYRYMLACGWPEDASDAQKDKLAAIAGLLAMIKIDDGSNLPHQMSEKVAGRQMVSELRFRGLLRLETTEELYRGLKRALPLVEHKAGVIQLAGDVFRWNDQTRKHWAYTYRWERKPSA